MEYDKNIRAKVVKLWNGPVMIPEEMGAPRADQMVGTEAERLCELSGRVCYDSLGTGRNSADYHGHIGQVRHFSTIEHAAFTVNVAGQTDRDVNMILCALANRPYMQLNYHPNSCVIRVTLDLRHVVEWDIHSALSDVCRSCSDVRNFARTIKNLLIPALMPHAPAILGQAARDKSLLCSGVSVDVENPVTDNEKFVSVFMAGGRGFSHEQVRHRFNMSQRSSRFCDESESPIIEHPLITEYLHSDAVSQDERDFLDMHRFEARQYNQSLYRDGVKKLQSWLEARGIDKTSARKQARGAMRNDLGNGLYTEMIFTASLSQWKHMFRMRSSPFADAEIREVYCRLLPDMQKHGLFTDWKMVPAPDGLGYCVVMPEEA